MEELISNNITLNDLQEFHTRKFDKIHPHIQLLKYIEEYGETMDATTLDDFLKELCDVVLSITGIFNSYDADFNHYMQECLLKVMNRQYPDKFKHID